MEDIDKLKMILREDEIPFFSDDKLQFYLDENGGDVRKAAYRCLLVKAENTSLGVSGVSFADNSDYFRRLAQEYRPNNSGILKGG